MKSGWRDLRQRREQLVARSVALRRDMTAAAGPIAARAARVDRVLAVAHRHPLLTTVVALALAALVPRPSLTWLRRGMAIYTLLRSGNHRARRHVL